MNDGKGLMTTRELGLYLGLSPASVLRRWRAGEIPGFVLSTNVVRFDRAARKPDGASAGT